MKSIAGKYFAKCTFLLLFLLCKLLFGLMGPNSWHSLYGKSNNNF